MLQSLRQLHSGSLSRLCTPSQLVTHAGLHCQRWMNQPENMLTLPLKAQQPHQGDAGLTAMIGCMPAAATALPVPRSNFSIDARTINSLSLKTLNPHEDTPDTPGSSSQSCKVGV
jgi:hypothetical protein